MIFLIIKFKAYKTNKYKITNFYKKQIMNRLFKKREKIKNDVKKNKKFNKYI